MREMVNLCVASSISLDDNGETYSQVVLSMNPRVASIDAIHLVRPLMLSHVMPCRVVLCHVVLCQVVLRRVMLCHVVLCRVMSCRVLLCRVMVCRVMLCHVVLCRVMLFYVVLCHVVFSLLFGNMSARCTMLHI